MLDDLAAEHDCDVVTDVADHRQVVTDEQNRQTKLLLQIHQQIQNRALHGHVQSGGDFVGKQNCRCGCQSPREGNALALTTRQRRWVFVRLLHRQLDGGEESSDLGGAVAAAAPSFVTTLGGPQRLGE